MTCILGFGQQRGFKKLQATTYKGEENSRTFQELTQKFKDFSRKNEIQVLSLKFKDFSRLGKP